MPSTSFEIQKYSVQPLPLTLIIKKEETQVAWRNFPWERCSNVESYTKAFRIAEYQRTVESKGQFWKQKSLSVSSSFKIFELQNEDDSLWQSLLKNLGWKALALY